MQQPQPLQYVLIDQSSIDKVLKSIDELKLMVAAKREQQTSLDNIRWMDNAELMEYLHISRRTTLTMRQRGLPCSQIDGKIFYRKDLVDEFLNKHQISYKPSLKGS